ncbi:hypothetical protein D9M73_201630 [compost metagenome]
MQPQVLGDTIDRTGSGGQQHPYDLARLIQRLIALVRQLHVQPALHFSIELGCGSGNGQVHVASPTDNAVELLPKVDCRSEHAAMNVQLGWTFVAETDVHRFESIVRQRPIGPKNNTCRDFDHLAQKPRVLLLYIHM